MKKHLRTRNIHTIFNVYFSPFLCTVALFFSLLLSTLDTSETHTHMQKKKRINIYWYIRHNSNSLRSDLFEFAIVSTRNWLAISIPNVKKKVMQSDVNINNYTVRSRMFESANVCTFHGWPNTIEFSGLHTIKIRTHT